MRKSLLRLPSTTSLSGTGVLEFASPPHFHQHPSTTSPMTSMCSLGELPALPPPSTAQSGMTRLTSPLPSPLLMLDF